LSRDDLAKRFVVVGGWSGVPSKKIFKEHTFEHYRKSIVDNHVGHYDVAETLFKALIHP
jgi:hypothetical protein